MCSPFGSISIRGRGQTEADTEGKRYDGRVGAGVYRSNAFPWNSTLFVFQT